jgi:hypothetical protein
LESYAKEGMAEYIKYLLNGAKVFDRALFTQEVDDIIHLPL